MLHWAWGRLGCLEFRQCRCIVWVVSQGFCITDIDRDLGGYDQFVKDFKAAGGGQFGSGWAWLVYKGGKLHITKTPNAETPVTDIDATPILTMDVWEHAYYLDYQNSRPNYMGAFLDNLVNWDFANQNLADAGA